MTDGTLMFQDNGPKNNGSPNWWKLTPDGTGSYITGTWSQLASLPAGYAPLYFASAVLRDGRLVIMGGEYNLGNLVFTNLGAIYDPKANQWTPLAAPAGWTTIGDAPSVVLPDGRFLVGQSGTSGDMSLGVLEPATLTWSALSSTGKTDGNGEEGWNLLPDGTVLAINALIPGGAQRYVVSSQQWISAGTPPVTLAAGGEIGPAVLRPDGTVFGTGATGNNAVYTPPANPVAPGTWVAAPAFPYISGQGQLVIADGPGCVLPNGDVLVVASPGNGTPPAHFFILDGTNLTEIQGPPNAINDASNFGRLLPLPTGQILFVDTLGSAEVYTPTGSPNPAWEPTITAAPASVSAGGTYSITGMRFNGLSQAAAYGDDYQAATNYPLVRISNLETGHVFYARTHDHSTMAVATGTASVSTNFDVPMNLEGGASNLVVVANGISSPSWPVMVEVGSPVISNLSRSSGPGGTSITITGTNFGSAQGTSTVTFPRNFA